MSTCHLGIIFFTLHATMHLSWGCSLAKTNVNVLLNFAQHAQTSVLQTVDLLTAYTFLEVCG